MEIAIIGWLMLATIVGVMALSRGRSFIGWAFIAVLISPLLAGILVLALGRTIEADAARTKAVQAHMEGKPVPVRRPARVSKSQRAILDRLASENAARQA
jgi:hypothetical protein